MREHLYRCARREWNFTIKFERLYDVMRNTQFTSILRIRFQINLKFHVLSHKGSLLKCTHASVHRPYNSPIQFLQWYIKSKASPIDSSSFLVVPRYSTKIYIKFRLTLNLFFSLTLTRNKIFKKKKKRIKMMALHTLYHNRSLRSLKVVVNDFNFDFSCKKIRGKIKNLIIKICREIEKTMPLNSLFVLSRYLERSPRYKDTKFS